jgi:hypothetical protein
MAKDKAQKQRKGGQKKKTAPQSKPKAKPASAPRTQKKGKAPKRKACMLTEALDKRDKMECLAPVQPVKNLKNDFAQSWGNLLDVIDAHLKIASVHFPNAFIYDTDSTGALLPPSVPFSHARSLWILICQYFLFRRGVISSINSDKSTFVPPTKMLPVGIAKFLQHFLPYVDPATGAQYKVIMSAYPTDEVYWDYPSVDKTVDEAVYASTGLSHPRRYALSHPANVLGAAPATFQPKDAGIEDYQRSGQTLGSTIDVYTAVQDMGNAEITNILSLFTVVDVDQIPARAPDASMFSIYNDLGVTNPCPEFDAGMSILLNTTVTNADKGFCHPYIKPKPPISLEKTFDNEGPETTTFTTSDKYQTILRNVYAYLMCHATHFSNKHWYDCLKKSAFEQVRSFTIIGSHIDLGAIGDSIAQLCSLHLNNPSDPSASVRTYWAFVIQCWGVIMRRIHKTDVITDANTTSSGNFLNYYNGYTANAQYEQFKLPASLATSLNSLGPVVVKGYLYIPYLKTDPGSWLEALTPAGVWDNTVSGTTKFGQSQWQYTGSKNITYPNGTPITYEPDGRQGKLPTTFVQFLTSQFQNMVSLPYNQGIEATAQVLGNPYYILNPSTIEVKKSYEGAQSAVNGWYSQVHYARTGCMPRICTPEVDGKMSVQNSYITSEQYTPLLIPCKAIIDLEVATSFNLSQITYTGLVGNQNFVAMRQAMSDTKTRGSVKTTKDGIKPLFKMEDGTLKSMASFIVENANSLSTITRKTKNIHKSELLPQILDGVIQVSDFVLDPSIEKSVTLLTDTIRGVSAAGSFITHTVPKALKLIEHPNRLFKAVQHLF